MIRLRSSAQGPSFRQVLFFFALSVLYNWLFNTHYLRLWSEADDAVFCGYLGVSIIMVLGLFVALSLNRVVFSISIPFVFFFSSITDYCINNYKIKVFNLNTVAFAFESNVEEAAGIVGKELVAWVLVSVVISVAVTVFYRYRVARFHRGARLWLMVASLVLSLASHLAYQIPVAFPFTAISNTFSYLVERYRFQRLSETRDDVSKHPFQREDEGLTIILIIGESARVDHFHINGYPRQTTPNLEALGALSFRDVTSLGVSTRKAVPCMMTRAAQADPSVSGRETSFISIFRKLGFHTAWISNQRVLGRANTAISVIANEADWVSYNNKKGDDVHMRLLDEDLLGALETTLSDPGDRKLVVLHTVGSHWLYDNHYPDNFRVFQPVCTKRSQKYCSHEELINAYDNSILYTDHFVGRVIQAVRDSRAIVFYVSDHGESLGEQGRYGHGHEEAPVEQKMVPMIVWGSDQYFRENEEKRRGLAANLDKGFDHRYLFHSILDCSGIESPIIDTRMSVCRPLEAEPSQAGAVMTPADHHLEPT